MKAITLTAPGCLELREQPRPEVRHDDDVLLQIRSVGVCGSDVHYYRQGHIGTQVVTYPFVLGHECSATVVSAGGGAQDLAPGTLVAVEPAISCGTCDQCSVGRPHTCRNIRFLACPGQIEGCLCEYLVMPRENCFPVPVGVTPDHAALIEPLSIGCYAARLAPAPQGKSAGVWGAGPIGCSVLLALREAGLAAVHVAEPLAPRRILAREYGATLCGDPFDREWLPQVSAATPLGLDVAIECCGQPEALDQAVALLKPGGCLLLVGIPAESRISLDIDQLRRKEITLINVRRQNGCVPAAIELLQREACLAEKMITHCFPLERTAEAFDLVAHYKDGVMKAMVHVGPEGDSEARA